MAESFNPAPSSSGPALGSVATDAAKLALPNTTPVGSEWLITGEANRLEKLVGSDPSQQANWLVLRNTVNLIIVSETIGDFVVNGVTVSGGSTTNVGWADPLLVPVSGGLANGVHIYAVASEELGTYDLTQIAGNNYYTQFGFSTATPSSAIGFTIPLSVAPRSSVYLAMGN